jgi:3-mercaptopyruvate sulfurtransferase SseA
MMNEEEVLTKESARMMLLGYIRHGLPISTRVRETLARIAEYDPVADPQFEAELRAARLAHEAEVVVTMRRQRRFEALRRHLDWPL